jgi:hypothetical protein
MVMREEFAFGTDPSVPEITDRNVFYGFHFRAICLKFVEMSRRIANFFDKNIKILYILKVLFKIV